MKRTQQYAPLFQSRIILLFLVIGLCVFSVPVLAADADGDGYDSEVDDCVDNPAGVGGIPGNQINPGATETWYDGVDQNCDELNDYDVDQDGYVDEYFPGTSGGSAPFEGDCNDADSNINPGATEVCGNGIDDDCDGTADNKDADLDTYIDAACGGIDCDDDDSTTYVGAPEICDGADNDCDGTVDNKDADLDTYLDEACGGVDCDDDNATVYPGATEIPGDTIDQNCDGLDCNYLLTGDLDGSCHINLVDFAIMAAEWLTDCVATPADPACVPLP